MKYPFFVSCGLLHGEFQFGECWFASDDCADAIASRLREGVLCCTVVVGEDSGAAITVTEICPSRGVGHFKAPC